MGICKETLVEKIDTPFFYSVELVYGKEGLCAVNFIEKCGSSLLKHDFSFVTALFIAYFEGKRVDFKTGYVLKALSPFTTKVLLACKKIPYGKTITYKELAEMAGSPKAFRAAGNALRQNPLPIVIPCHRVIGTDGSLRGFMGKDGLEIKKTLLSLEGIN